MTTSSIMDFVYWLGTSAGIMTVLSLLTERVPWFQALTSKTKQIIMVVIAVALPELVFVLLNVVPVETWALLEPHFQAIWVGLAALITVLASEAVHAADKRVMAAMNK